MHKHLLAQKPKDESALKSKKKVKSSDLKAKTVSPKKDKKTKSKSSEKASRKKKHKDKKLKKEKKKKFKDSLGDGGCELSSEVFEECKDKMRAMKKAFKALGRIDESRHKKMSDDQKEVFHEHIKSIGAHIDSCLSQYYSRDSATMKEWRNNLWTFVSKFTEHRPKKLYKIYRHERLQSIGGNTGNISAASSDHSNASNHFNYHHRKDNSKHQKPNHKDSFSGSHKREPLNIGNNSLPNKISKHSYRDYPSKPYSNSSYHHHNSYNDMPSNRGPWSKYDNSSYRNNYNSSYNSSKNSYNRSDNDERNKRDRDRYYQNDRSRSSFRDSFSGSRNHTNSYSGNPFSQPNHTPFGNTSDSHTQSNYTNATPVPPPPLYSTSGSNSWANNVTTPPTNRPLLDTPPVKRMLDESKSPLLNRFDAQ